ncbi:MAG: M23 family metallopeptidase, partial [Actinobacteria bacterium]|nr:M23 family metallopeptidase [Actinomycetota bacterium]
GPARQTGDSPLFYAEGKILTGSSKYPEYGKAMRRKEISVRCPGREAGRKLKWIYAIVPFAVILIAAATYVVMDIADSKSINVEGHKYQAEGNAEVPELYGFAQSFDDIKVSPESFAGNNRKIAETGAAPAVPENPICAPFDGGVLYPFTRDESIACGKWPAGSLDLPFFGAPRENGRLHAGVDLYPVGGELTPIKAVKNGTVIKVELFFVRSTGEKTYAVLVDHGDLVANYAELKPPAVTVGQQMSGGELLGCLSGTEQLHFELYSPGTVTWVPWYGDKPVNLQDPTGMMLELCK